jgi:hypothetical protein
MKCGLKEHKKRFYETKCWFFENINKIENPIGRSEETQINKVVGDKEDVKTNSIVSQRINRNQVENLFSSKPENLG